jgi:uridine kinase
MPVARGVPNREHPDALDLAKFAADLGALVRGSPVRVKTKSPRHNPAFPQTRRRIPLTVHPGAVIIAEGFLLLHDPRVRRVLARSVFLEAPARVLAGRRRKVHTEALGFTADYEALVHRPMSKRFVLPTRRYADLVLDSARPTESLMADVLASLAQEMTGASIRR